LVRRWYEPLLERLYDYVPARIGDLDQLEQIAANYASRERFLSELTLDPPNKTSREAGTPTLDEDYVILSTIHSAKGQEWDATYILNVTDGCIPSDMATGKPEEIDEERRLLYVAMTRARQHLELIQPMRFFTTHQPRFGRNHVLAPRSRFLPDEMLHLFHTRTVRAADGIDAPVPAISVAANVGERMRAMWR
jgi:DNA helicase-2/ATP-dependent DNA helicase PcrA